MNRVACPCASDQPDTSNRMTPFLPTNVPPPEAGYFTTSAVPHCCFKKPIRSRTRKKYFRPSAPDTVCPWMVRHHQACLAKDVTHPHGAGVVSALCGSGIIDVVLNISTYHLCYPGAPIDGVINSMRSRPCSNKGGARHFVHPFLGLHRIGRCGGCGESRSRWLPAGFDARYKQAVAIIRNPCRSDWTVAKPSSGKRTRICSGGAGQLPQSLWSN